MNRRLFVIGSVLGSAAVQARFATKDSNRQANLKRAAISSWSFHDLFAATRDENSPPLSGSSFDIMNFPEMLADRYKVHAMEVVAPHFASTESGYLGEFKKRLERAHSQLINIPVDIPELEHGAGLSDRDATVRTGVITACKKWIDVAAFLGAQSVRCDPGKIVRSDLRPTIASYQALASYAGSKGLYVLIENHGGVGSEHPEELVEIFRAAGKYSGALPDFGNFPDEQTRQGGLKLLFPFARTVCHVKDPRLGADYKGGAFDFAGCVATSKKAGFQGFYSIEAEFGGDPYVSVGRLLTELNSEL